MKKLIFIAILLGAVSCVRYDIDEVLLPREDISLTVNGSEEFSFNPLTCQIAHNTSTNEYRVYDDKLSGWFILRCDDMPANEGQKVNADLSWTANKGTKNMNNLTFSIEKTDASGKIWMWCKKKNIGIVIKNL